MRFLPFLPLLAATSFASSDSESSNSSSTSEKPKDPTPIGAVWTSKWKDSDLTSYIKKCASSTTYKAQIYTLGEMYPALKDWAPQLKVFYSKQHYPGSWEGSDVHGEGRTLMKMDMEDVPFAVREWIQRNPKQRHFSVQEDVIFFAPGAIYPIAPLWVDEPKDDSKSESGECEGVFGDLEKYSPTVKDGVVLGKVSHEKTGKNEVDFKIEAFKVVGNDDAKAKDEL